MKTLRVKVNTKSNYRGLNGQWLEVKECRGTRVSCNVETEEHGLQTVDFSLNEIVEIDTTGMESSLHPIFSQILKPYGIK